MNKWKKVAVFTMGSLMFLNLGMNTAQARWIGNFSNFQVTYSGGEAPTSFVGKSVTDRRGVVNLNGDTGTAWVTANMRNSAGAFRGGVTLQRNTRRTFATPNAQGGFAYRLGIRKTNNTGGGSVNITGSWSPDEF